MNKKAFYTVNEVAKRYGVDRSAVWLWIKNGLLRVAERHPNLLLIAVADLEDFEPPHVAKGFKPGPVSQR